MIERKCGKDINLSQVREICGHCQNCGKITSTTRSDFFKCEYCGEFILEQRKMETSSKEKENKQ